MSNRLLLACLLGVLSLGSVYSINDDNITISAPYILAAEYEGFVIKIQNEGYSKCAVHCNINKELNKNDVGYLSNKREQVNAFEKSLIFYSYAQLKIGDKLYYRIEVIKDGNIYKRNGVWLCDKIKSGFPAMGAPTLLHKNMTNVGLEETQSAATTEFNNNMVSVTLLNLLFFYNYLL